MSYEGYTRYLCKNGHLEEINCYDDYWSEAWKCHICGEPEAWSNMVNTTNGSFETDENGFEVRIDGYIELELSQSTPMCRCSECGHEHATGPAIYKVPGPKCDQSPDHICHYDLATDRDGVACVELLDGTLDHKFPRINLGSQNKKCIYCGREK